MKQNILYWQDEADRETLKNELQANGICITSTDTVIGLLAKPTAELNKKLNILKGRDPEKPILLLIESPGCIQEYVQPETITQSVRRLLTQAWPGPVTFIFKARSSTPEHLVSDAGTIALRSPAHEELRSLVAEFGLLYSTSANKAGKQPPYKLMHVAPELLHTAPAVIVDRPEVQVNSIGLSSTIIDLSSIWCKKIEEHNQATIHECDEVGLPRVVRAGAAPIAQLESHYGQAFENDTDRS